ncbi:uncharacterized protein LOC135838834 isoform X2 [Planococcus citri]|uniref:uncharacterized protein LOC135838834 isoform X2 n=1 Tax=Planococcus citri TaxID=170843 RepID=UPI0031F9AB43
MLQLMKIYMEEAPAPAPARATLSDQSADLPPSIPLALALKMNARIKRQPQRLSWTTQRPIVNRISNHNWADESECIRNCPATNQWKPVCGTDNLSYANMNKLRCAQMCGKQVAYVYNGSCYTTEPPTNTSPIYSANGSLQ